MKKIKSNIASILIVLFFLACIVGVYILTTKAIQGSKIDTKKTTSVKTTKKLEEEKEEVTTTKKEEKTNDVSSNDFKKINDFILPTISPSSFISSDSVKKENSDKKIDISNIGYNIPSGYSYEIKDKSLIITNNESYLGSITYIEGIELPTKEGKLDLGDLKCGSESVRQAGDVNYHYRECNYSDNKYLVSVTDSKMNGIFLIILNKVDHDSTQKIINNVVINAF